MQNTAQILACCGLNSIVGFPYEADTRTVAVFKERLNYSFKQAYYSCTLICLAGDQIQAWEPTLLSYGATKLIEFVNSSSGHECRIYAIRKSDWHPNGDAGVKKPPKAKKKVTKKKVTKKKVVRKKRSPK